MAVESVMGADRVPKTAAEKKAERDRLNEEGKAHDAAMKDIHAKERAARQLEADQKARDSANEAARLKAERDAAALKVKKNAEDELKRPSGYFGTKSK